MYLHASTELFFLDSSVSFGVETLEPWYRKKSPRAVHTTPHQVHLSAAGQRVKRLGLVQKGRKRSIPEGLVTGTVVSPSTLLLVYFPYATVSLMETWRRGPYGSNTHAQASKVYDELKAFQDMAWWHYLRSC